MSYRARLNRVRTRVGKDPGNVLKISGGGGTAISMRRAACSKKCVSGSIPGSFSIVGPKPPGDVAPTNVNTRAMLDRKTSYRKYPMGTVEDYTSSGIVFYNYPDKHSHDSSHIIRLKRLQNINQCDCTENLTDVSETNSCCKSTVSGTRHRFALNTPTTTNTSIINVVQDKNIKISSEYMAQITRLNNDIGWKTTDTYSTVIYIGSDDRKLWAFNSDGTTKWVSKETDGTIDTNPAISSDGTIYVGGGGPRLWAFNPDGTTKWKSEDTGGNIDQSSPAIGSDGTIYVGNKDNRLWAFYPDGNTKWKSEDTGGNIDSSPIIGSDGTIYVGSDNNRLWAFYPDGITKWKSADTGDNIDVSPAIGSDGTIYVGGDDNRLWAFNPDDGSTKWNSIDTGGNIDSSPAIGEDGTIYAGNRDGKFLAFSPDDGSINWQVDVGSTFDSDPVIGSDGTIYVGNNDNRLWAFNPNGTIKWVSEDTGDFLDRSPPAIGSDGTIYVGSDNKSLWAFNPNGTTKWVSEETGGWIDSGPAIATYKNGKLIRTWYFTKNKGIRRYIP